MKQIKLEEASKVIIFTVIFNIVLSYFFEFLYLLFTMVLYSPIYNMVNFNFIFWWFLLVPVFFIDLYSRKLLFYILMFYFISSFICYIYFKYINPTLLEYL